MNQENFRIVPIDNLRLDPENPRIPPTVNSDNQSEILTWMATDGSIVELMGSIAAQGYFPGEPLLAIPSSTEKENFIVVEGNRRLAATMFLNNPDLAKRKIQAVRRVSEEAEFKPKELPVLIYQKRSDILKYLGYRHVTGVKQWEPLAKARYIKQLYDQETGSIIIDERIKSVAKIIGSRSDYIGRILVGFALYQKIVDNDFFNLRKVNEEEINFSLLTTSINYNSLVEFLGLNSATDPEIPGLNIEHLKLITAWLFEPTQNGRPRIGESRNIRELSLVVQSQEALASFTRGDTLNEAYRLTEDPTTIFRESVRSARRNLETALNYGYKFKPDKVDIDQITDVKNLASSIEAMIKETVNKPMGFNGED